MDVPPLQNARIDVANIPLEQLAGNKQVPQSQKIAAASQAFEALLLRQILSETQRPVFHSKLAGDSTTDGIYRDMVVNQLADNMAKSGSLGLAKSLSTNLQRKTTAPSPGSAPAVGPQRALHPFKGPATAVPPNTETTNHD